MSIEVLNQKGTLQLTLNRPEKLNAINTDMYLAMTDAMTQALSDDAVKVVVLAGAGDFFCSGNDIADFIKSDKKATQAIFGFLHLIHAYKKPLVAKVNGPAVGIGATLLLHCDLVVAAEDAYLQFPFTQMGLCPEAGSSYLLPRALGIQRANRYLLSGDRLPIMEAYDYGIISRHCDKSVLDDVMETLLEVVTKPSLKALMASKALTKSAMPDLTDLINQEAKCFFELLNTPEVQADLKSFMTKE